MVDAFREQGIEVQLVHGEESGKTVGKRQNLGGVEVGLDGYAAASTYGRKQK